VLTKANSERRTTRITSQLSQQSRGRRRPSIELRRGWHASGVPYVRNKRTRSARGTSIKTRGQTKERCSVGSGNGRRTCAIRPSSAKRKFFKQSSKRGGDRRAIEILVFASWVVRGQSGSKLSRVVSESDSSVQAARRYRFGLSVTRRYIRTQFMTHQVLRLPGQLLKPVAMQTTATPTRPTTKPRNSSSSSKCVEDTNRCPLMATPGDADAFDGGRGS
jgi:hypothetical protein